MSSLYKQSTHFSGATRFVSTPMAEVEFSSMVSPMTVITDLNAGDITPVLCLEVLPHSTFEIDMDYICRLLSAAYVPTMGTMQMDVFGFWCSTRQVNESWKNVLGENTSGFWSAPEVELAPLSSVLVGSTQIPIGSVADYYDLPTQAPIPNVVLAQMSDTKIRQYLECYNCYFRDQNYQNPIPYSKLNISQNFLSPANSVTQTISIPNDAVADGSIGAGAIVKAVAGEGGNFVSSFSVPPRLTKFSALNKPLKANKLHDAFTSVLPSPQKGADVVFGSGGSTPVVFDTVSDGESWSNFSNALKFGTNFPGMPEFQYLGLDKGYSGSGPYATVVGVPTDDATPFTTTTPPITSMNLKGTVDLADSLNISVNDLRQAVATQQVLELLARGGSRYWSFLKSFFGIEVDDPFPDIPTQICHYRSELDMYQVAQTSATQEGSSPQGSLAAFGYTTKGSGLFTKTFIEHGFIHFFAIVRHRSIYTSYCPADWFKRSTLDFYLPQYANISEQPVRLALLNPFREDAMEKSIGYQEAHWDYRFSVDRVRGIFRSFDENDDRASGLDIWHYGNYFDGGFTHVNGDWLKSDSQEILDRTLVIPSDIAPQFVIRFDFKIKKQLPMPVYSVPGLDTL